MSQLRLFPPPRPLLERLGPGFFRALPRNPGVYCMHDASEKVIYIGKAKNLHQRLSSYKYLTPEKASRKSIRLIHSVYKITWEECLSDLEAQIRENYLLRTMRPRFNVLHVYPQAYCFIGMKGSNSCLQLLFSRQMEDGFDWHGAFKPGSLATFAALLRLLWFHSKMENSYSHFPPGFSGERPPRQFAFANVDQQMIKGVSEFLDGSAESLLTWHARLMIEKPKPLSHFEETWLKADLELLSSFFGKIAQRNFQIKQKFQIQGVIPQIDLNDLILRHQSSMPASFE